jgi:hypothetical protein
MDCYSYSNRGSIPNTNPHGDCHCNVGILDVHALRYAHGNGYCHQYSYYYCNGYSYIYTYLYIYSYLDGNGGAGM